MDDQVHIFTAQSFKLYPDTVWHDQRNDECQTKIKKTQVVSLFTGQENKHRLDFLASL